MAIQAPKGTKDVTPKESYKWQYIEAQARGICEAYGFREIRTPVIEHTELFLRGVGDTTDIVQKEMYTFDDKGGRSITLKPEGTAGAARMFLEHGLFNDAQPTKMYYLYCPVFRYDKPQAGRLREHHQFGVEVYGAPRASADAECIRLAMTMLSRVGVQGLGVHINSIGCPNCRPKYNDALRAYLRERYDGLCETCKSRFEKNPLRILDCKEEKCKFVTAGAPKMIDYLCGECKEHFEKVQQLLAAGGLEYTIDPNIVRGLDYYTKTVFEFVSENIGAQGTVCGGGRYDGLIEELGGSHVPAVGFAAGMERLILLMENTGVQFPEECGPDVFLAGMDEESRTAAFGIACKLRSEGISAECDHMGRSLKAQFKYADKIGARHVVALGGNELESGECNVKRMSDGSTEPVKIDGLCAYFKGKK